MVEYYYPREVLPKYKWSTRLVVSSTRKPPIRSKLFAVEPANSLTELPQTQLWIPIKDMLHELFGRDEGDISWPQLVWLSGRRRLNASEWP